MRHKIIKSKFVQALTELRTHLNKCASCKLVLKGHAFNLDCGEGQKLALKVAAESTRLGTLHRKAYANPHEFIYACPDRSRHGLDYANTAEPHLLTAMQESLF